MSFTFELKRFKIEYYIILLPLFFVLHGFNSIFSLISWNDALVLLFEYLVIFISFYLFALIGLKTPEKASLFTFVLMLVFFFFGWAHDLLKLRLHNTLLTRYSIILPIIVLALILICDKIKKTTKKFHRISYYFNFLFAILIAWELVILYKNYTPEEKNNTIKLGTNFKPDVYFIVVDGYAGHMELKDILNYENSNFLNLLQSRDFHIVSDSKSNYNLTPYSIASTLKMGYLDLKSFKENPEDVNYCFENINSNDVINFFKKSGYKLYNYSIFRFNNTPPLITSQFFQIGPDLIHSQTLLGRMERDIAFNLITKYKLKWAMKMAAEKEVRKTELLYQKTIETANQVSKQPRFIYSHFMMPHYPYYLDSVGNFNAYDAILEENWSSKKNYLNYLKYCNTKLIKLVDYILLKSTQPPIIILMSDHGFREFSSEEKFKKYYFMNLNAIFLPNKNYPNIKEGISNVNEFRYILNAVFNENTKPIPDSTFYIN